MFSLTEWIIVALVALIVFGSVRPSKSQRQRSLALEDLRPLEPVAVRSKGSFEVEWAVGAAFLLAAAGCVLALVAAHAGWV